MIRVGVVGATGYAGAELVRILAGHPQVELTVLTSRQYAGVDFDQIYPSMRGVIRLPCEPYTSERVCDAADVIFTALPHKLPMTYVPRLIEAGKKVIDLSADFRFRDAAVYESAYEPHTAKELLERSVYGLTEIYRNDIRRADLIGNPGCYPTSILLPLIPLIRNRLVDPQTVIADSKSGVSGAGRSLSLGSHFCEVDESFRAYKVTDHRHAPEMEEVLGREAREPVAMTFVPHLVPMIRGMLSTTYATVLKGTGADDIEDCLSRFYAGSPFVRLLGGRDLPDTRSVRGTNFCDIAFRMDERRNRLVLISAIDNLVKGAAGQAVQNMNLMCGFDEAEGLRMTPFPV